MSDKKKSEWKVQVFRKSLASEWESLQVSNHKQQQNKAVSTSATAAVAKKTGDRRRRKKGNTTSIVRAGIQKGGGAIVIFKLRFRILLQQDAVVTRRHNCLRVQLQQGVRVLVLRFRNDKECQGFCDALLQQNENQLIAINHYQHQFEEQEQNDDGRYSSSSSLYNQLTCRQQQDYGGGSSEQDRQSALFYVARLLYDPEFLSTVLSLEKELDASPEGRGMLDDLQKLAPI